MAAERPGVRAAPSPPALSRVRVTDGFLGHYIRLVAETVIPYQWKILHDEVDGAEKSHCIDNFSIAAGRRSGQRQGVVFLDSDLYKWLEAVGFVLQTERNPALETMADEAVELIAAAQQPDGYLNTYYDRPGAPPRWSNLREGHEMYCAGHLIEAAVAYFEATGKRTILSVAERLADCLDRAFGEGDGQRKGYPGHPELELALVKLHRVTGRARYLALARYFLTERGAQPYYFDEEQKGKDYQPVFDFIDPQDRVYSQSHEPPARQTEATGHAVRAVYLYAAMADVAAETGDAALALACRRLFDSITKTRMYITGGIGSARDGERFTTDYDLPSAYGYAETCASIGLMMFASRMMRLEQNARYVDTVEKAFYNTALSGVALTGTEFFYVNPLEVNPDACRHNPDLHHVKAVRQPWFSVACCPTNVARTLASLAQYIYARGDDEIYINLYIANTYDDTLPKSGAVSILLQSDYPFGEDVLLTVRGRCRLALRVPSGCTLAAVTVDGRPLREWEIKDGYLRLDGVWDDTPIRLTFDMPVIAMRGHPRLRDAVGRVAIQRGPIVYCLEEMDNFPNLRAASLPASPAFEVVPAPPGLPREARAIRASGRRLSEDAWKGALYAPTPETYTPATLTAVPYCLWNNRTPGEMLVWIEGGYSL